MIRKALAFILLAGVAHAVTITAAAGGGNWSSTGTWVGAATPTAADDVVLAVTSGSVTVDTGTCVSKSVTATAFIHNLNFSAGQTLTVSGNVQLDTVVSGMTISGTGVLSINAAANLLSAGQTFTGTFVQTSATTSTFADTWNIAGSLIVVGSSTFTSNGINVGGSFTCNGTLGGTTTITMNGSGTWSCAATNSTITKPVIINTSGTVTLGSIIAFASAPVSYIAGTVVNTGSKLTVPNGGVTFNTGAMHWNDISFTATSGSTNANLQSNLVLDGGITFSAPLTQAIQSFTGAFNVTCANLYCAPVSIIRWAAGTTMIVNNSIVLGGSQTPIETVSSGTSSSSAFLTYNGPVSNMQIFGCKFTDIDASSSPSTILNYFGSTLTRTSNISNTTPSTGATSRGYFF